MASIADMTANTVAQLLVPKVDHQLHKLSDFWSRHLIPGQSESASRVIGKGWKVVWNFATGMAGAAEFSGQAGPEIATTPGTLLPTPPSFQMYDQIETWQGIQEVTAVGTVQQELQLKKIKVNMLMPTQLYELEELDAQTASMIRLNMDGFSKRVADLMCNSWWSEVDSTSGLKCIVGKITTAGSGDVTIDSGGTGAITLAAASSGALGTSIRRWHPSQAVDIWTAASPAVKVNTQGPVFVDVVDGFGTGTTDYTDEGTIKLYAFNGASYVLTVSTSYFVTPRNSNSTPVAMQQLLINSGALPYGPSGTGLDVGVFTDLKSLVRGVSGPLTETVLLKYLSRYHHVKGHFNRINTLMSTEGVWASFFHDMLVMGASSPARYERNGQALSVKGGVADNPSYQLFGQNFEFMTEGYMPAGSLYGVDTTDGNYKLVRPNPLRKIGKHPMFPGIQFLAQMFGFDSLMMPYNQVGGALGGAFTNMMQMPGQMPYEIMVERPGGIRLYGLTEFTG